MSEEKECNQVLKGLCNCKCVKNGTYPCFIEREFLLKQQLKAAKEENEYRDNMLCEQIEIWRSNCDVWMNQSNKFEQQNKQMRVALENVKFEAEFNGNDESLQKIINIVDNTLKGGE